MSVNLLVGSYNKRLQILQFDPTARTLNLTEVSEPIFERHTWITRHPTLAEHYYATQNAADGGDGLISLIRVSSNKSGDDAISYTLEVLQTISSRGSSPCHLGVKHDGSELAVSNYASSNYLVCSLGQDGKIINEELVDLTKTSLPVGPNQDRQDAPHPHGCYYTKTGELLVPDLGCDVIRKHGKREDLKFPPGSGPRHLSIHRVSGRKSFAGTMSLTGLSPAAGNILYIVNELDNTVCVHSVDGTSVRPQDVKSLSILPEDCTAPNGRGMKSAEILLSPDACHIYATNRDEGSPEGDSIAHFSISADGLTLTKQSDARTGLQHLRGAELFESEGQTYLIVGTRESKGVAVYACDKKKGTLDEVARNMDVFQPSSFALL